MNIVPHPAYWSPSNSAVKMYLIFLARHQVVLQDANKSIQYAHLEPTVWGGTFWGSAGQLKKGSFCYKFFLKSALFEPSVRGGTFRGWAGPSQKGNFSYEFLLKLFTLREFRRGRLEARGWGTGRSVSRKHPTLEFRKPGIPEQCGLKWQWKGIEGTGM